MSNGTPWRKLKTPKRYLDHNAIKFQLDLGFKKIYTKEIRKYISGGKEIKKKLSRTSGISETVQQYLVPQDQKT